MHGQYKLIFNEDTSFTMPEVLEKFSYEDGISPVIAECFRRACLHGHIADMQLAIAAYPEIAGREGLNKPFLHSALEAGQLAAATLLIEHKADIHAVSYHGLNIVHSAVLSYKTEVLDFVLGLPQVKNDSTKIHQKGPSSPMHYALVMDMEDDVRLEMVERLLAWGAQVNVKDISRKEIKASVAALVEKYRRARTAAAGEAAKKGLVDNIAPLPKIHLKPRGS